MSGLQTVSILLVTILAAGIVLLGVLSVVPRTARSSRALWRLMATQILIVAVAIAIFWFGRTVALCAVALAAFRIGFESGAVDALRWPAAAAPRNYKWLTGSVFALAAIAAGALPYPWNLVAGLGLLLCSAIAIAILKPGSGYPASSLIPLNVMVFPGVPVFLFALAVRDPQHYALLLLAFLLNEVFDSFALLGGRLFGRTLAFPKLSPRKTVEGLSIGAAALSAVAGVLPLVFPITFWYSLFAAVIVAAGAVAGDLLASAPKRAAGVKDYPAVIREQGGLLDIADSWLVTGPLLVGFAIYAVSAGM